MTLTELTKESYSQAPCLHAVFLYFFLFVPIHYLHGLSKNKLTVPYNWPSAVGGETGSNQSSPSSTSQQLSDPSPTSKFNQPGKYIDQQKRESTEYAGTQASRHVYYVALECLSFHCSHGESACSMMKTINSLDRRKKAGLCLWLWGAWVGGMQRPARFLCPCWLLQLFCPEDIHCQLTHLKPDCGLLLSPDTCGGRQERTDIPPS